MDKVFIDQMNKGEHEEAHVTLSRHWKASRCTVLTEYPPNFESDEGVYFDRVFALDHGPFGKDISICSMEVANNEILVFVTYADKTVLLNRGYNTTKLMRKALDLLRKTLERSDHLLDLSVGLRQEISAVLRDEIKSIEAAQESAYTFLMCHRRSRKHPQIKFDSTLPLRALPNELAQEIAKQILTFK